MTEEIVTEETRSYMTDTAGEPAPEEGTQSEEETPEEETSEEGEGGEEGEGE
jgi:hypothetical protein